MGHRRLQLEELLARSGPGYTVMYIRGYGTVHLGYRTDVRFSAQKYLFFVLDDKIGNVFLRCCRKVNDYIHTKMS
jgi:hypothetical protein